jgi:hypothetical protein
VDFYSVGRKICYERWLFPRHIIDKRKVLSAKMYAHKMEKNRAVRREAREAIVSGRVIWPGLADNERRKIFKGDWTYV